MTLWWSALVPVFSSTIVVALSIILLASGTTPATANQDFWLSVNVSRIGQDLIRITPTNSSAAPVSSDLQDDSSNTAQENARQCLLGNLTACLQPPALPTPVLPTPAASATSSSAPSRATSAGSSTVLNLTQTQPRSDIYNLYVTKVCQGKFTDEEDPDSNFVTTGCFSYSDEANGLRQIANVTSAIPSSLVIGNTANISVPALAVVKGAIASVIPSVASVSKVIFALVVIRIIAGTLALAGSALLFVDIRRFAVFTMLTFATLANVSLLLVAGITTGVVILQAESISGLAEALSVEVQYGVQFLILEWVTAVFAIVGSAYWLVVWFVEFRTLSFSRRRRTDRQIGNWKGVWSELMGDLRGDYQKL